MTVKATGLIAVVLVSAIALVGFTNDLSIPARPASESVYLASMIKPLSASSQERLDLPVLDEKNFDRDKIPKGPTNDAEMAAYLKTVRMYTESDKSLEAHIKEGAITPEIVSDDFTLNSINHDRDGVLNMLLYSTKSGHLIQINVNKGYHYFDDDVFERLESRDIKFDQRTFTLLEFADHPNDVTIFHLLDKNSGATSISMMNISQEDKTLATKEEMLDAAKHLTVHNSVVS